MGQQQSQPPPPPDNRTFGQKLNDTANSIYRAGKSGKKLYEGVAPAGKELYEKIKRTNAKYGGSGGGATNMIRVNDPMARQPPKDSSGIMRDIIQTDVD